AADTNTSLFQGRAIWLQHSTSAHRRTGITKPSIAIFTIPVAAFSQNPTEIRAKRRVIGPFHVKFACLHQLHPER
ncbi:hypothetical protein Q3A80_09105, partial [Burkholderia sp. SR8]|uniref:hypothetical protein n=1 Tax=Burkholderia sp. SR8 TaxID=3062277 RepID=UPI00406359F6